MKKTVALVLVLSMLLSVLSLSGCKKRDDGTGDTPGSSVTGPEDLSSGTTAGDHDVTLGEDTVSFYDLDLDTRVVPQGVLPLPVSEDVVRGAVAEGSFDFTSDNADGSLLIPIGTVPKGTVITIPVTYDGVPFSVMVYDQGEAEFEYFAAFDVSPAHGISGEIGFSQITYNGYTSYLVCNVCGQVIRQDSMAIGNDTLGLQFCRPWTLPHEECFTFDITADTLATLGMYGWISDGVTGEYAPGVPYVSTQDAIGKQCILIMQDTIKNAYEEFMLWEIYKQFDQGIGLPADMMPTVPEDSDTDTTPVDDGGLPSLPTAD